MLIARGLAWLTKHQNSDGGWGDTTKSFSNISTTMLCHAVFHAVATGSGVVFESASKDLHQNHAASADSKTTPDPLSHDVIARAKNYIDKAGGVPAVIARYGKDRTFSIPILTHCALAGLVDWREITPLPFELACLPANFYKWVRLPVVSYALPALIAIGQARYHFVKPWNPIVRWIRNAAIAKSLRVLERIQPPNGGFLEATPLTSFVTMSLAGIGLADHPVARRGIEFIIQSVRPDGSWPIDTNLATWVTTLSINALGDDLPADAVPPLRDWLLGQQYLTVHPYTNAAPGGWAWTDLAGGVPDGDDTPGAMLACLGLESVEATRQWLWEDCGAPDVNPETKGVIDAESWGEAWLGQLQNSDGGWPTFCRGWGNLPFDRSAPDLTAHVLRAYEAVEQRMRAAGGGQHRLVRHDPRGFNYLSRTQHPDGSWLPLWFGNQHCPNDENKTYGTARVLAAYRDCGLLGVSAARRGLAWLRANQNKDGGWGGAKGTPSSVEETALAVEMLVSADQLAARVAGVERSEPPESLAGGSLRSTPATQRSSTNSDPPSSSVHRPPSTVHPSYSPETIRGLTWLCEAVETGNYREASPIGFYFAKLWYYEKLYPIIFTVAALRRAARAI
jgi:squalene-hopene/tetraprenyl-beta-curcumene cyclase